MKRFTLLVCLLVVVAVVTSVAAGDSGLDRDKDGVPCESICPGG